MVYVERAVYGLRLRNRSVESSLLLGFGGLSRLVNWDIILSPDLLQSKLSREGLDLGLEFSDAVFLALGWSDDTLLAKSNASWTRWISFLRPKQALDLDGVTCVACSETFRGSHAAKDSLMVRLLNSYQRVHILCKVAGVKWQGGEEGRSNSLKR